MALGIPRNTPDFNNPKSPQKQLYQNSNGYILSPDQIRILILELAKLKGSLTLFPVATTPDDPDAWRVRLQYADILRRADIDMLDLTQKPSGPNDEGIIFEAMDPSNMSINAQKVQEALAVANILPKLEKMPPNLITSQPKEDFALFIAPRPIQWH